MRLIFRPLLIACAFVLLVGPATAQDKLLTLDDLYGDPQKRPDFSGAPPGQVTWLDDANYITRRGGRALKVSASTGQSTPLYDSAKLEAAFAAMPGFSSEIARRSASGSMEINEKYTAGLINTANDIFLFDFAAGKLTRLTNSPEAEVGQSFSPDGRLVAFVRNFNLYVVEITGEHERALTNDGNAKLLNGRLDWVYQEELYGRSNFQAYWWSPDSTKIAYLQLDESPVKDFVVVDHIPVQQEIEITSYPKAGAPNPNVKVGVISAAGGSTRWLDTYKYQSVEPLVVRVGWKPDSSQVVFLVQNREQTWMDVNFGNAATGKVETAFRETSRAWISRNGDYLVSWLKDGSFVWSSERSGFQHIYLYSNDCKLIRPITSGKWEVKQVYGVDEPAGWVYFSGTERNPVGSDAYRIRLDGSGMERLTDALGTHQVSFDPHHTQFLDTWSDINTPPQTRLYTIDRKLVRVVDENRGNAFKQYKLGKAELMQVKTRDGFPMEAMLIRPPDFDPSKKYPVYIHTYGGPGAPQVRNGWGGNTFMWHQLLAQKGYLIWICDNRSASGKGVESEFTAYKKLGPGELQDIEDGISWLKTQPWVDGSRIGISGWSYGGFMTAYALTHSTSFKTGIAGAPVTDWRLYDSIYTERYMATPQNNLEGYDSTSVIRAAKNLSGKLLLIHGTIDDNVHMQNSIQFIYELEKAGKQFQFMTYPKSRHGVTDQALVRHMREMMLKFILENL